MTDDLRAAVTVSPDGGIIVQVGAATILPAEMDLVIPQGAAWTLNVTWMGPNQDPKALFAGAAAFDVRQAYGSAALIALTGGAGITLSDSMPNIVIARTAAQTTALNFVQARYSLVAAASGGLSGGGVQPLLSGLVRLEKWAGA